MEEQNLAKLAKAKIYEVNEKKDDKKPAGEVVHCMFNPYEYSITRSNQYKEEPKNNSNVPQADFEKAGAPTLTLSLTFDGYEKNRDVSEDTKKLWKMMDVKEGKENTEKVPPPMVAFEWGKFYFEAVITQMTQKFTLFDKEGKPLRAKVDVTFTQYKDLRRNPRQNPTSGGGPVDRVWRVKSTDRIDTISYEVFGDAGKWRLIADRNGITNPLVLHPGQQLIIPREE